MLLRRSNREVWFLALVANGVQARARDHGQRAYRMRRSHNYQAGDRRILALWLDVDR